MRRSRPPGGRADRRVRGGARASSVRQLPPRTSRVAATSVLERRRRPHRVHVAHGRVPDNREPLHDRPLHPGSSGAAHLPLGSFPTAASLRFLAGPTSSEPQFTHDDDHRPGESRGAERFRLNTLAAARDREALLRRALRPVGHRRDPPESDEGLPRRATPGCLASFAATRTRARRASRGENRLWRAPPCAARPKPILHTGLRTLAAP
jgi:hypothetical protein